MKFNPIRIKECAEVFNGKTPAKKEHKIAGKPILKIRDINEEGTFINNLSSFVDDDFYKKYHKKVLKEGDTLVLNAAHNSKYVGSKTYFVEKALENLIPTGEWLIIRANPEKLNSKFLNIFVNSPIGKYKINSIVKGIHLYPKDVERITIPIPENYDDQICIAAILSKAEALIVKRKEQLNLFDDYLKSVFFEMFGDPRVKNRCEMIDFGKVIDVLTDYHANGSYEMLRNHVELKSTPDYALMVRTTDLENNNFTDDVKYISKEAYEFLEKSKVYGGEIIINKIGSAGNVYLMPHLNRPVSLGMNAFLLRFKEFADTIFIYHLLTSDYGKWVIASKVKGAVTKTIRKDAIRSLRIPLPPIDLQNKFASIVQQVEQTKQKMRASLDEMDNHFNALMQRYFG